MGKRIVKPIPRDIPVEVCRKYMEQYYPEVYQRYSRFIEDAGGSLHPGDKKVILGILVALSGGALTCFYSPIPWVETAGMISASFFVLGMLMVWLTPEREDKKPQDLDAFLRYNEATRSAYQEIAQRVYELMLEIQVGLSNIPNPQGFLQGLYDGKNEAERSLIQLALKLLNE